MATVLITGSTSGIGYSLCKIFARNGYNLITVARNLEKLNSDAELFKNEYSVNVEMVQKDLVNPNAAKEVYDEVKKRNLQVDILINNAGKGIWGEFTDTDLETEIEIINLNILALTSLTKYFLKDMRERNAGRILNTASTASFAPGPLMSVYFASKAYVLHFSEAIAEELRNTKITVSALCPGPTNTNFAIEANSEESKAFNKNTMMSPDEVAKVAYDGLLRGERVIIPGIQFQFIRRIQRLLPRQFLLTMYRMANEKSAK